MAKQSFTTGQILTAAQMTTLQANDYNQTVSAKVASYTLVAADAGTRITMSNASPTTITVNTALFTAGDTLTITNIGAGACTITAGTATVSTAGSLVLAQYDSGTLYFSSTSAAIWNGANPGDITGVTAGTGITGGGTSGTVTVTNDMATTITTKGDLVPGTGSGTYSRLAAGANNTVLTADSTAATGLKWATPTSGGYTSIASGSFSGASVSVSSIPATYRDIVFIWRDFYFVNDDLMTGYVNGTTGIYTNQVVGNGDAPMTTTYFIPQQSETTDNTDNNNFLMMRFYDYANTSSHKIVDAWVIQRNAANTTYRLLNSTNGIRLTAAISTITFGTQTGANIAGGTYSMYGVS